MQIAVLSGYCHRCSTTRHGFCEPLAVQMMRRAFPCPHCGMEIDVALGRMFIFNLDAGDELEDAVAASLATDQPQSSDRLADPTPFLECCDAEPGSDCSICLESLTTESNESCVRIKACGHIFHRNCIEKWLRECRACCPLCKKEL